MCTNWNNKKIDPLKPRKKITDTSKIGKHDKHGEKNPNAKKVINLESQLIFNTMISAASFEGLTVAQFRRLIKIGKYKVIG